MGLTIVWMTFICVGVLKMVAGRDSGDRAFEFTITYIAVHQLTYHM